MLLTKAEILGAIDSKMKEVSVPEWGGEVMIKTMTAAEKGRFEMKMIGKNVDLSSVLAEYASLMICDADGKKLFSTQDVKALGEKNPTALQRIFDAGQELGLMTQSDLESLAGN